MTETVRQDAWNDVKACTFLGGALMAAGLVIAFMNQPHLVADDALGLVMKGNQAIFAGGLAAAAVGGLLGLCGAVAWGVSKARDL